MNQTLNHGMTTNMTILVVDDEQMVVDIAVTMLTLNGHIVVTVSNGKEALEVLRHNDVHKVILDIRMPVMDGVECYKEIRKRNTLLPIVFCSGQITDDVEKIADQDPYVKVTPKISMIHHLKSNTL